MVRKKKNGSWEKKVCSVQRRKSCERIKYFPDGTEPEVFEGMIESECAQTHNPNKFLMLALPCHFSNLFIALMVFCD